jgi:hypothetical protein
MRYLKDLNTELATAILHRYPTAQAFRGVSRKRLAKLTYDSPHQVGAELAEQLIDAAAISVDARRDLQLVHRGLRHRRPQGRQGAARRVERFTAIAFVLVPSPGSGPSYPRAGSSSGSVNVER